jgi:hypothetical protein
LAAYEGPYDQPKDWLNQPMELTIFRRRWASLTNIFLPLIHVLEYVGFGRHAAEG